jgi:hypothetical protein
MFFRQDWTRHGKAAPFKRNDGLLLTLAIDVLAFPAPAFPRTSPTTREDSEFPFGSVVQCATLAPSSPYSVSFATANVLFSGHQFLAVRSEASPGA